MPPRLTSDEESSNEQDTGLVVVNGEPMWQVIEILAERGNRYRVKWAGNDPATGKPWAPSWVNKQDCTSQLIDGWNREKELRRRRKLLQGKPVRTSTTSSKSSMRSSRRRSVSRTVGGVPIDTASTSTPVASRARARATRLHEDIPLASSSALLDFSRDSPSVDDIPRPPHRKKPRLGFPEVVVPTRRRDWSDTENKLLNLDSQHDREGEERGRSTQRSSSPGQGGNKIRARSATMASQDSVFSVPPTKIGPPRGRKRKRVIVDSQDEPASSAPEPSVPEPPVVAAEEDITQHVQADITAGNAFDTDPSYWQFDFGVRGDYADRPLQDSFSREAMVPETQPCDNSISPRAATPERLDSVHPGPVSPTGGSVKSQMKRRSHGSTTGKETSRDGTILPALPLPSNRQSSGGLSPIGDDSENEDVVPKQPLKTFQRIPIVSPSVFRPHLPAQEVESPPSSIEQFSSPEKGSRGAVRRVFEKVERQMRHEDDAPGSTADDESLRLRGHQLAEEAAATIRKRSGQSEDDYDCLFRESATPEPVDSVVDAEEAIVESTLSQHDEPEDVMHDGDQDEMPSSPAQPEALPSQELAEAMADAYIDFNAGQPTSTDNVTSCEPVVALTLGPDLPRPRRKLGPLEEARKNRKTSSVLQDRVITQRVERIVEPSTVIEEYPLTTSTQQADVDGQSLEHPVPSSQHRELAQALEEAHARIQELEQALSTKNVENIQLQTENEDLAAALDAASSKLDEHSRLSTEASARCALLEQEVDAAKQARSSERQEWEKKAKEQDETVSRLRASKEESDLDRDLFREYYGKASSHAMEMKAKKEELEVELSVAQSQLSEGLSLIKGMYEERIKRIQEEADKWKSLCEVLAEKDERTNDDIRRRAAEEPELREEVRRLQMEVAELRAAKLTCVPLAPEPTPGLDSGVFYVCQFVDVPKSCMCNATFESPEEVEDHALREHYPELLGLS
ncbi:hypothetical protein DAEQUDRAFT_720259 [Daedalea quercina L-15889]|uniref:Chromo domain-containing protein n=1 Tax=Daedalea quercina L-15889 TaxID=1314783 RepID=A0A165UKI6_9APHY|nr:hypothetical protein DAEQUDRAFT_720259 [Daedalea quercina L-15889]